MTTSTAKTIDGVALSAKLRADIATRAMALKTSGITPGLAVILVGDDPASAVYVRNKVKALQIPAFIRSLRSTRPPSARLICWRV